MQRTTIVFVILMSCALNHRSAHAQWVYVGNSPQTCAAWFDASIFDGSWHIAVHAPDEGANAMGVIFRLESDAFGPEDDVTMTPSAGVSVTGDLLSSVAIVWSPRSLSHESVVVFEIIDNPPYQAPVSNYLVTTRDAELLLGGGVKLPLEDVGTELVHCYGGSTILWQLPDDRTVPAGGGTVFQFRGIGAGTGEGPLATSISAIDELGWVELLGPTSLWGDCGTCPWLWSTFSLSVEIPPGVSAGTENKVTLLEQGTEELIEFVLIAGNPVPIEARTWGRIKRQYEYK